MYARHRKQLRAMAQGAKTEWIHVWRRKWEEERSPSASRTALFQVKICATFPKALGFTRSSKKGLQPPAIINYGSKFLV
jgi:hypothetical protein